MKVIDLLNKIANGEELPKKIKYYNFIYELYKRDDDFYNYKNDNGEYFDEAWLLTNILNDEVEIIEDTPKVNLPSHDYGKSKVYPKEDKKIPSVNITGLNYNQIIIQFANRLNEIINRLNGE